MNLFTPKPRIPESCLQTLDHACPNVVILQSIMKIPETGVYDLATVHLVQSFQREYLMVLSSDGFVGPETARVLRIKLVAEGKDSTS